MSKGTVYPNEICIRFRFALFRLEHINSSQWVYENRSPISVKVVSLALGLLHDYQYASEITLKVLGQVGQVTNQIETEENANRVYII